MTTPSTTAGGLPIALGALGGAVIGAIWREATIGFLTGLGLGVGLALLIWWRGR